jgi:hypothetical protein
LAQVGDVLHADQRERWLGGERVLAETYLEHLPALGTARELAIDLIYAELLIREELGESPPLDEYLGRFPQFAEELRQQVELHRALDSVPSLDLEDFKTWGGAASDPPTVRPSESPASSAPPTTIAGYEILDQIGRGGMGVVYRAWQAELRRVVALKMILAGADASPASLARFRIEAEAVARLEHPNIVQVYDVGQREGCAFLALELVHGGSLAQSLAGAPQPLAASARLVETLARAMHHAHRRGVVHRDLTPSNVLLTAEGVPKIADFGLAKLIIGGAETCTKTGDLLGTPSYMAPEQAAGKPRGNIAAADVYALGAILYEMLTGRPPFRGETPLETLRQVVDEEPVPPSHLRPRLPRDLNTICLKCLEKEPARRYPSAEALAEDLRRFLDDRPILARWSGPLGRAWRWSRRNPAWAVSVPLVMLLLAVIALISSMAALGLRAAEREKTEQLRESLLAQATAGRAGTRVGRRFDGLEAIARAAAIRPSLALRNEAIAYMALTDLRLARRWSGMTGEAGNLALEFDPRLERYARSDGRGTVSVRRVGDDGEVARLPGPGAHAWSLRFSPDGRFLAIAYHTQPNRIVLWDLDHPQTTPIVINPTAGNALDFSPDSRTLAVGRPDGSISLCALPSCEEIRRLGREPRPRPPRLRAARPHRLQPRRPASRGLQPERALAPGPRLGGGRARGRPPANRRARGRLASRRPAAGRRLPRSLSPHLGRGVAPAQVHPRGPHRAGDRPGVQPSRRPPRQRGLGLDAPALGPLDRPAGGDPRWIQGHAPIQPRRPPPGGDHSRRSGGDLARGRSRGISPAPGRSKVGGWYLGPRLQPRWAAPGLGRPGGRPDLGPGQSPRPGPLARGRVGKRPVPPRRLGVADLWPDRLAPLAAPARSPRDGRGPRARATPAPIPRR